MLRAEQSVRGWRRQNGGNKTVIWYSASVEWISKWNRRRMEMLKLNFLKQENVSTENTSLLAIPALNYWVENFLTSIGTERTIVSICYTQLKLIRLLKVGSSHFIFRLLKKHSYDLGCSVGFKKTNWVDYQCWNLWPSGNLIERFHLSGNESSSHQRGQSEFILSYK